MNIKNRLTSSLVSILISLFILTGCSNSINKSTISNNLTFEVEKNYTELGIRGIMEELTSDNYLSRVVGTDENTRTQEFIKDYFEYVGLEPFNNDTFYHEVNLTNEMRRIFNPNEKNNNEVNNIIGVIKGKDSSKAVVISAHLDHVTVRERIQETANINDSSQMKITKIEGAIDNASGVSVLLESAKDLASKYKFKKPKYDIIFAAFNAEELGLIGSSKFVDDFKDKYDSWYNINIDCIGIKGEGGLAVKNSDSKSQPLYDDFIEILEENNIYYEMVPYARNKEGRIVGSSDHMSFRINNYASLVIGQDGIVGIVHTKDDNMSIVDFDLIENTKNALVDFIIKNNDKEY